MPLLSRMARIRMDLYNVIYISYQVPATMIRSKVPGVLPLQSSEKGTVYLSLVAMECRQVRLAGCPWPRFNYDQLNLRTYVTDPGTGEPAVYFLKSGVSMGLVPILTRIMGIPWEKISFKLEKRPSREEKGVYHASGHWLGGVSFEISSPAGDIPDESKVRSITGPLTGFMGTAGRLRRFGISHRALRTLPATMNEIRFPLLADMGLVSEDSILRPDNVLLVPEAEFTVHLPPSKITSN